MVFYPKPTMVLLIRVRAITARATDEMIIPLLPLDCSVVDFKPNLPKWFHRLSKGNTKAGDYLLR